jgi:deazaflavin-dependent oxidoreductase (nitroreductase family)
MASTREGIHGVSNFNQRVIDEFRGSAGVVGGFFEGRSMILVHNVGAKSGTEYITPLVYQQLDGGDMAIFASYGGGPKDPAWFHNVAANPELTVEVGTETFGVTARVAEGEERHRIWEQQKVDVPGFAEYEGKAAPRQIPVIVLERGSA